MVRNYKRSPGSRAHFTNYTSKQLSDAIEAVKTNKLSLRKAAKTFNVPYATLHFKCKTDPEKWKKHGGQTCLTKETEQHIVNSISKLTKWRVQFDSYNVRCLVKGYLDNRNITDKKFKNNLPGEDWILCFIKRNDLYRNECVF